MGKMDEVSGLDGSVFYCSQSGFDKIAEAMEEMADRAVVGGFKRCQTAYPVHFPDGRMALLVGTFDIGEPVDVVKAVNG